MVRPIWKASEMRMSLIGKTGKYLVMSIKNVQPGYETPEIKSVLYRSEGVLCLSISAGDGNSGVEKVVDGDNWEGLL